MSQVFAPVALFVYRRLDHTQRTIQALLTNEGSRETDVVVYSDGPRGESDAADIQAVRSYLREVEGFKSYKVIEREKNFGLSKSIIGGVNEMLSQYERVIVLEDDLVTSKYFLRYMNDGLQLYAEHPEVACVHGYVFPVKQKLPETFFLKGADCWGWATWRRAWSEFNPDGSALKRELQSSGLLDIFDYQNKGYFSSMLDDQIAGRNDSWAIRWYASAFLKNRLTLYPGHSLVLNIGLDGSGQHCSTDSFWDVEVAQTPTTVKLIPMQDDQIARSAFTRYFRESRSFRRLAINKISKEFSKLRQSYGR